MLKNLGQFFDAKRFFEGKKMVLAGVTSAVDFKTKNTIGKKVDILILDDKTPYHPSGTGSISRNIGEKFSVKVLDETGNTSKLDSIPLMSEVKISGFSKCDIYVDKNGMMQLSANALDVVQVKDEAKK